MYTFFLVLSNFCLFENIHTNHYSCMYYCLNINPVISTSSLSLNRHGSAKFYFLNGLNFVFCLGTLDYIFELSKFFKLLMNYKYKFITQKFLLYLYFSAFYNYIPLFGSLSLSTMTGLFHHKRHHR